MSKRRNFDSLVDEELSDLVERAQDTHSNSDEAVDVSVVVLVTERPDPLDELYAEVSAPLLKAGYRSEFLFVTEPWTRELLSPLETLAREDERLQLLSMGRGQGESAMLKAAVSRSRGHIILTLPAYRRVDASSLPGLLRRVDAGADVVLACRWPRKDSWLNRVQSRVFHAIVKSLTGQRLRDIACGVRAMRREVIDAIPLYGDFYRFLPILALQEGFDVVEMVCTQHPLDARIRLYSPGVYLRRMVDLLGLFFLVRFTYKPLRFFGMIGSILATTGGGILAVLLVQRVGGQGIADRPLLLLGTLVVTLGVQSIALGLIGEIIVHLYVPSRKGYRVRVIDQPSNNSS